MNARTLLDELNATVVRRGRHYLITHIDGQRLTKPKVYQSKRELTADLLKWWEDGWQNGGAQ